MVMPVIYLTFSVVAFVIAVMCIVPSWKEWRDTREEYKQLGTRGNGRRVLADSAVSVAMGMLVIHIVGAVMQLAGIAAGVIGVSYPTASNYPADAVVRAMWLPSLIVFMQALALVAQVTRAVITGVQRKARHDFNLLYEYKEWVKEEQKHPKEDEECK